MDKNRNLILYLVFYDLLYKAEYVCGTWLGSKTLL